MTIKAMAYNDLKSLSVSVVVVNEIEPDNGPVCRWALIPDSHFGGRWVEVTEGAELPIAYRFGYQDAEAIYQALKTVMETDPPQLLGLHTHDLELIRKFAEFLARERNEQEVSQAEHVDPILDGPGPS